MTQTSFEFDVERDRTRLATLAGELALKNGTYGITCGDLRMAAETRGILTGAEDEARMNQLKLRSVMFAAGLVSVGTHRRSRVPQAKRSMNAIYFTRECAPPREGAA